MLVHPIEEADLGALVDHGDREDGWGMFLPAARKKERKAEEYIMAKTPL